MDPELIETVTRIAEGPSAAQQTAVVALGFAVMVMCNALSNVSLELLLAASLVVAIGAIAALFRRTSLLAKLLLATLAEQDADGDDGPPLPH